jgi:hypothetical protein
MTRRLTLAALTVLAVSAASATPAFAADRTPLAWNIEQASDSGHLQFNENLHTVAGDRKAIKVLINNAYECEQGAALVARTPAIPAQQADKAQWLQGDRLQARMDVQMADAVYMILSGNKTEGFQQISALGDTSNRVDTLTARAEMALGLG